jgi:hypothetical protein
MDQGGVLEEEKQMTAIDVLNDVTGGVARPLRSRVFHVIASLSTRPEDDSEEQLLVGGLHDEEAGTARNRLASLYSICGLLFFYQSAMEKAIRKLEKVGDLTSVEMAAAGNDSDGVWMNPLIQCMRECISNGAKGFVASLKVFVATIETLASASNETQPVVASELIMRLCQVRLTSPGFGIVTENIDEETANALSVEFLCDHVFEPVFPRCANLADVVAMKSALTSMKKVGLEVSCASKWQKSFADKEKLLIDAQIDLDVEDFLQEAGLARVMVAMKDMESLYVEGMVASSHPGLSQESLQKAIEIFYATLYDPPIPSYVGVKDPALRTYAKNKVVEKVTACYEDIHNFAKSDRAGYQDISFFKYDSIQVKAMLSS